MINKKDYEGYLEERIEHMFYSKENSLRFDVNWYFEYRNEGLAGIGPDEVKLLCQKAVRDLRVWRRLRKGYRYES